MTDKKRLWQVDALRGLALLSMLGYHAMYDWVYVFGHTDSWYDIWSPGCHVWQQYICWSFIILSGFSFTLSRKPLKNGLIVAGCAALLSFVTIVFMPSEKIIFGVLHLNACAVLLSCLLQPVLGRIPAGVGLAASALLFVLTNQLPAGYLGFEALHIATVPAALYKPNIFWLGFPDLTRFYSADYFPLLPWLFLFWVGYFLARVLQKRIPAAMGQPPAPLRPLSLIGSHTLFVYMLHQPVIYGALWLFHAMSGAMPGA